MYSGNLWDFDVLFLTHHSRVTDYFSCSQVPCQGSIVGSIVVVAAAVVIVVVVMNFVYLHERV